MDGTITGGAWTGANNFYSRLDAALIDLDSRQREERIRRAMARQDLRGQISNRVKLNMGPNDSVLSGLMESLEEL